MHYVIGDIHGCLREWLALKKDIEKKDDNAEFILLGDVIDRGPQVVEMCDWFVDNVLIDGRVKSVIGNHEWDKIQDFDRILSQCKETDIEENWEDARYDIDDYYGSIKKFPTYYSYHKFLEFCRGLPFYIPLTINNKKFIIAHGDIPSIVLQEDGTLTSNDKLTKSQQERIVWDRNYGGFNTLQDTIIICGHTPTIDSEFLMLAHSPEAKEGKVYHYENRYNIDCGCVFWHFGYENCNLAALCLETEEVTYLRN